MPIISTFFGIVIRMFYDEHKPPHIHVEYQGHKSVLNFSGNIVRGNLKSRTALKLVREWMDLHIDELKEDWKLASTGKEIKRISPLK